MSDPPAESLLDLAISLARQAGDIARAVEGRIEVLRKPDDSLVTETDHTIQEHILAAVAEAYPDHAVIAEEPARTSDAHRKLDPSRYTWVIDPLDGTRNFVAGVPCFATAIAVLDHGRPMVGVVAEHRVGHLYAARLGMGTTMNGRPVRCDEPDPAADWLLAIPSSKDALAVAVIRRWAAEDGFVTRNLGSMAFHLALTASGALTAAFGTRLKIWDLAAGWLLVTEAGGRITDPFGNPLVPFDLSADPNRDIPILAAAPNAHARLLETIRSTQA